MSEAQFEIKKVQKFAEIEQEFMERVTRFVYCNMSTIDTHNRPRSRILHPIWEGSICWFMTSRHSLKAKHLATNPYVSLAYIGDSFKPLYVDGTAEWIDDLHERQRVWEFIKNTPPPMGYDPALSFKSYDDPEFGLLKVTPWRIEVYSLGIGTKIWQSA